MNKLISSLTPEVTNFIKSNYPVVKKRTALWFFSNEVRNECAKKSEKAAQENDTKPPKMMTYAKMMDMWKKMDPESKRKYFNMAEFDLVRYKAQRSQWISEVTALLMEHGNKIDKLSEAVPTFERMQEEFLNSLEKWHRDCENMIQYESTRTIYKNALKNAHKYDNQLTADQLISNVPKNYRPVLVRPRRPPTPFALFLSDEAPRLSALRKDLGIDKISKIGADEWAKLSPEEKSVYVNRYSQLMVGYTKAMMEFKSAHKADDNHIEQANKEKKVFKKSLRKKLRDSSVMPLSIRNAFNFFLMDNKDIPMTRLSEIWRNLPEEEKARYYELNRLDTLRYQREREAYSEIIRKLSSLIDTKSIDKIDKRTEDD